MIYRCPEDNRVMDATTTKGKFKCPRCGKFWDAIVHTAPDGLALAEMVIAVHRERSLHYQQTGKDRIFSKESQWNDIVDAALALREKASGK